MLRNTFQFRPAIGVLAAGSLWSLALLPARADMTLYGQQTVGTGQAAPETAAVRLLYQGTNARLETAGQTTLVYDGKSNILYGLDTARKSYFMTVPTETEPTDALPSGGGGVKEYVKLDFHETSQTLTLAGQPAHQYTVSGTVTFTRIRPQGTGRRGGRRRGGGGFPGGGFPLVGGPVAINQEGGGRGQNGAFTPAQWSISGEIWLADSLKFPAKENALLAAQLAAVSAGPFQQPLADALDKHKGLPLLARMTVTHTPPARQINQFGGVMGGAVPTTTVTTFTVRSVSDAPLNSRLFGAPLDYTLVAAPLTPYTPGLFSPAP